jgi:ssDNA-specific exonuclease RecJ
MSTKEKFIHLYTNNIQVDWTPIEHQLNRLSKNIRIEKNQIYIIKKKKIQFN